MGTSNPCFLLLRLFLGTLCKVRSIFFIQITDFDFIGKPVEYRSYEIKAGLVEILNITSDNRAKT